MTNNSTDTPRTDAEVFELQDCNGQLQTRKVITTQFARQLEQALGYLYQLRYALLQTLRLPEGTICFIEKDDDIDFSDPEEGRILASLKHKAPSDTLTDLSPDFWKSVRVWLDYYIQKDISTESVSFYLFTTGHVANGSFLQMFLYHYYTAKTLK